MYQRIVVPLDGSPTAESVLPACRTLARRLNLPVELMTVIDLAEMARSVSAAEGLFLDKLVEDETRRSGEYLFNVKKSFEGISATTHVGKGHVAEAIIERAASGPNTLIMMATHGRSGINRFLLGSVAEKLLRGGTSPLLLVRASEGAPTTGELALRSIIVPLDGSELAEGVLPTVEALAKQLGLAVTLFRAYAIPYGAYSTGDGFYDPINLEAFLTQLRVEANDYLEAKANELRRRGVADVSCVAKEGLTADEVIQFAKATPDNLVAMCSHGRSGVKRWALGSVTETVVRHSGDPVLVIRSGHS